MRTAIGHQQGEPDGDGGTFTFTSPDGIKSLIDRGPVISNDVFTATSFTTSRWATTLSVTGYNAATGAGVIAYSYTLIDNRRMRWGGVDSQLENFAVVVTEPTATRRACRHLVINIIDDVPTAHADTDSVAAGSSRPETGNVMTADRCDRLAGDGVATCWAPTGRWFGRCGGQHQCRPRQRGDVEHADPGQPTAS